MPHLERVLLKRASLNNLVVILVDHFKRGKGPDLPVEIYDSEPAHILHGRGQIVYSRDFYIKTIHLDVLALPVKIGPGVFEHVLKRPVVYI